jgi:hypothetical protein
MPNLELLIFEIAASLKKKKNQALADFFRIHLINTFSSLEEA